jgi:hypothetical protein
MAAVLDFIKFVGPTTYADLPEQPITAEEILIALRAGARHKAPGIEGFCLEFYTVKWGTIQPDLLQLLNHMFLNKDVSPRQKHVVLICLSKSTGVNTPDGYRPISPLNTEYKILVRIICRRLRHILADQLQDMQFCGVRVNSILDAISGFRDVFRTTKLQVPLYAFYFWISKTPLTVSLTNISSTFC